MNGPWATHQHIRQLVNFPLLTHRIALIFVENLNFMKANITFLSFLLSLLITISAQAQIQEMVILKGIIVSETSASLPFVNILLNTTDGTLVKATISDIDGNFNIKNIQQGMYILKVSSVGYQTISKEINAGSSEIDLGKIQLKVSTESLDAVTLVAEKPIIQVEPDKTVFNVANTVGSAGNNGLEILRKAPGVRLDNDNNVIVEGKTGVLIYIDGRQSFLAGDDLT